MTKINQFYYINKLFLIYGFQSNINRNLMRKFFSILIVLTFLMDFINSILYFIKQSLNLLFVSWIMKFTFSIVSYVTYRHKHKTLFETIEKLSNKVKNNKSIRHLSLLLSIFWLICNFIIYGINTLWVSDQIENIFVTFQIPNSSTNRVLIIIYNILFTFCDIFYVFGSSLLQILCYLQTNYIMYCLKREHFENLSIYNCYDCVEKLRRIREYEIRIQAIDHKINDLIGFIPIVWFFYMFVILCIVITQIATTEQSLISSSMNSIDVILFLLTLIIIIGTIGQLNQKFDINKITEVINETLRHEDKNDLNLKLEINLYLQEVSNRCNNKPKPCGLFVLIPSLILSFISSVITFSVMCIQLKSSGH